jgi:hypothetical protein
VIYFILDFTNNEISLTLVQGRTAIIVCEILLGTARHKQISGGESLPHWYLPNDKGFAVVKGNEIAHERIYVKKRQKLTGVSVKSSSRGVPWDQKRCFQISRLIFVRHMWLNNIYLSTSTQTSYLYKSLNTTCVY